MFWGVQKEFDVEKFCLKKFQGLKKLGQKLFFFVAGGQG